MQNEKEFYLKKINDNNTYKSFCNTMRNDSIEDVKILLDRLEPHLGTHPRYETLKQLFNNRINDIQK